MLINLFIVAIYTFPYLAGIDILLFDHKQTKKKMINTIYIYSTTCIT
jgi:hypothetical protein